MQSYLFDADIAARLAGRLAGHRGGGRRAQHRLHAQAATARPAIASPGAGATSSSPTRARAPPSTQRLLGVRRVLLPRGPQRRRHPAFPAGRRRARCAPRLGVAPDERVVGMFASFKRQKNHPLSFAAARRVLDRAAPRPASSSWGHALGGPARLRRRTSSAWTRLVDELGIRERACSSATAATWPISTAPATSRCCRRCSRARRTCVLESLASGVPVVATDVADNPFLCRKGRSATWCPSGTRAPWPGGSWTCCPTTAASARRRRRAGLGGARVLDDGARREDRRDLSGAPRAPVLPALTSRRARGSGVV